MQAVTFSGIKVKDVKIQTYRNRSEILQVNLEVTGKDREQFAPFLDYQNGIGLDARRNRLIITQAMPHDDTIAFKAFTEPKQNHDFLKAYQLVQKIRFPKALMPINPNTGKPLLATTAKAILMDSIINTTVSRLPKQKAPDLSVTSAQKSASPDFD